MAWNKLRRTNTGQVEDFAAGSQLKADFCGKVILIGRLHFHDGSPNQLPRQGEMYAKTSKLTIEKELGGGYDGVVLATSKGTAIKAFRFTELYRQELTVYRYLAKWRITEVNGFHIPRLVGFDNNRAIIEMTVVSPPFVVDFVGAKIEMPIDYDDEWYEQKKEEFEDDWPTVRCVIWGLQEHGIYLSDVHPGNIRCR